jgi:hypothetical protein
MYVKGQFIPIELHSICIWDFDGLSESNWIKTHHFESHYEFTIQLVALSLLGLTQYHVFTLLNGKSHGIFTLQFATFLIAWNRHIDL